VVTFKVQMIETRRMFKIFGKKKKLIICVLIRFENCDFSGFNDGREQ
jgi:hypothetical protein